MELATAGIVSGNTSVVEPTTTGIVSGDTSVVEPTTTGIVSGDTRFFEVLNGSRRFLVVPTGS